MHTTFPNHSPPRVEDNGPRLKWQPVHRRMTIGLVLIVVFTTLHISRPPPTHATTQPEQNTETTTSTTERPNTTPTTGETNTTTTDTTDSGNHHSSTSTTEDDPAISSTSTTTAGSTPSTTATDEPTPTSNSASTSTDPTSDPDQFTTTTTNPETSTTSLHDKPGTTIPDKSIFPDFTRLRGQLPRCGSLSPGQSSNPVLLTTTTTIPFEKPCHRDEFSESFRINADNIKPIDLPEYTGNSDVLYTLSIGTPQQRLTGYRLDRINHTIVINSNSNIFNYTERLVGRLIAVSSTDGILVCWSFGIRVHRDIELNSIEINDQLFSQNRDIGEVQLPTSTIQPICREPSDTILPDSSQMELEPVGTAKLCSITQNTNYFTFTDQQLSVELQRCVQRSYSISPDLPIGLSFDPVSQILSGSPSELGDHNLQFNTTISLYPSDRCSTQNTAGEDQTDWIEELSTSLPFRITVKPNITPKVRNSDGTFSPSLQSKRVASFRIGEFDKILVGEVSLGNHPHQIQLPPALSEDFVIEQTTLPDNIIVFHIRGASLSIIRSQAITITVVDRDGERLDVHFILSVNRDSQVTFTQPGVRISGRVGIPISRHIPHYGGNQPLVFSIQNGPPGISINERGDLENAPTQAGNWTTDILVRDSDGDESTTEIFFTISSNVFSDGIFGDIERSFTDNSNISVPRLKSYKQNYRYGISPTLPRGLIINSITGIISGIASELSSIKEYTVSVTENERVVGEAKFNLSVVRERLPSFPFEQFTIYQDWQVNRYVNIKLPGATGGDHFSDGDVLYLKYEAVGLPSGLVINQRTATITGTPSSANESLKFQITATDRNLDIDSMEVTVSVLPEPVPPSHIDLFDEAETIDPITVTNGDKIYVVLPPVAEGSASYSYEIRPELPSGLAFDQNALIISGQILEELPSTSFRYYVTNIMEDYDYIEFTIESSPNIILFDQETSFDVDPHVRLFLNPYSFINWEIGLGRVRNISVSPPFPSWFFTHLTYGWAIRPPANLIGQNFKYRIQFDFDGKKHVYEINLRVVPGVDPGIYQRWDANFDYDTTIDAKQFEPIRERILYTTFCRWGTSTSLSLFEIDGAGNEVLSTDFTLIRSRSPIRLEFSHQVDVTLSGTPSFFGTKEYKMVIHGSTGGVSSTRFTVNSRKSIPSFGLDHILGSHNTGSERIDHYYIPTGPQVSIQLPKIINPQIAVNYTLSPGLFTGFTFNSDEVQIEGGYSSLNTNSLASMTRYTLIAKHGDGECDTNTNCDTYVFTAGSGEDILPTFREIEGQSYITSVYSTIDIELPKAQGGNGPLQYSLSYLGENNGILAQFTHDNVTNVLSGIPTTVYPSTILRLTATDQDGQTDSIDIQIVIQT